MKDTRLKDEEQVSRLLGGLDKVDAPANFESGVLSRIADGGSDPAGSPVFWLALKFAVPLVVLVVLGAFFIVSDESTINADMIPPVGAPGPGVAEVAAEPANRSSAGTQNASPRMSKNQNVSQPPSGPTSEDRALSQDNSTLFPPGLDPRNTAERDPSAGGVSAVSILEMLGVSSACTDKGCRVTTIQPYSVASKVGLRTGDLIEALDDKPVGAGRSFGGELRIRSVRVLRDGGRITIPLTAN